MKGQAKKHIKKANDTGAVKGGRNEGREQEHMHAKRRGEARVR